MSDVGSTYVPSIGPSDARIMVVGEAPGADEETQGAPFVGQSGHLLMRYLGRHRIARKEVFLTNLCKYRPRKNEFAKLLGSNALEDGLEELRLEIERVQPNIIVACGNWPMYFLTGCTAEKGKPGTGIVSWRGSVMPCTHVEGYKVLITYHPAYIVRPQGFHLNPVFNYDLSKVEKLSKYRELRRPKLDYYIDPPDIGHFVSKIEKAPHGMVGTDIETFGDEIACVGYASEFDWGLCITGDGDLDAARYLWEGAPLCFQFGNFDLGYMRHYYGWVANNYVHDTYVAAASLMPEFPRGLDFLTSVYTDFPFYKTERKVWKDTGDLDSLWRYNIKDVVATLQIGLAQRRELDELWPARRHGIHRDSTRHYSLPSTPSLAARDR